MVIGPCGRVSLVAVSVIRGGISRSFVKMIGRCWSICRLGSAISRKEANKFSMFFRKSSRFLGRLISAAKKRAIGLPSLAAASRKGRASSSRFSW